MNNLHLNLNDFRNASRVLKEAETISRFSTINHVFIAALCGQNTKKFEKVNSKITINRFELKSRNLGKNFFFQCVKYFEFSLRIILYYLHKDVKVINVHSVKLLPLGYLLKSMYHAKYIYDAHELETETHGLTGLRKKLLKLIERILIKKADQVFVVSESIADWYQSEYGIKRPTVLLNAPRYTASSYGNYFRNKFAVRNDQKIVLYQGNLKPNRGIEELIAAFIDRENKSPVLVFMGDGTLKEWILNVSARCPNIFLHDAVPPENLLNYSASADLGIHLIPNTCLNHNFCMPNKLFEYLMAGLPVLVSDVKEMRKFVEKYQVGISLDAYGAGAINAAIDRILTIHHNRFARNTVIASLENSWEAQEKKMLTEYMRVLS